jgi:hypothetical protein
MAVPDATLLNNPEKCTTEGKALEHHLPGIASNMQVVWEFPWPGKNL